MSQGKFHIKGSSLSSKFDFVAERFGEEAAAELKEWFRDQAGDRIVLDANWYPFSIYDGLLRTLADRWLGGDLERLREVGAFSAEKALTSAYESYAREKNFHRFLERMSMLHGRFYSSSSLVVKAQGDNFCEVGLVDVPTGFEAAAQVAAGFYAGAARFMGHQDVRCALSIKGGRALFRLDW